jgi:hypothetical protein
MSAAPQTLLVIEPTAEAPRNSEGDILPLADGRLALVYSRFTGGGADDATAHISLRTSADGGATWSDDEVLVSPEGELNVMSPALRRLPDGELLVFYMIKDSWGSCRLVVRRSADELASLGEPVVCTPAPGYHVVNNDRPLRLSSGRLLVPAALHACPDGTKQTWSRRAVSLAYRSDDAGRTWRGSRDTVAIPAAEEPDVGLQEPGVVELADGRVLMYMRTDLGCQYQAVSEDGGETWSPPAPGPLASPRSPATLRRLPWSGALLAVWNDHSGRHPFPAGKRTPLCAAVSTDEAASWGPSRVLEDDPEGWYCYTSITVVDEAALLTYCAGDSTVGGLNRLKVTRLPRAWLDEL